MILTVGNEKLKVSWRHQTEYVVEDQQLKPPRTVCTIFVINSKGEQRDVFQGVAVLSEKDNYSRNKGRKISMARAIRSYPKKDRIIFWRNYLLMRKGNWD